MEKCPLRTEPIDSSDEPHCYFKGNRCTNDIQETCLAFGGILAAGWRPPLPEGELASLIVRELHKHRGLLNSPSKDINQPSPQFQTAANCLARAIMEKQKGE